MAKKKEVEILTTYFPLMDLVNEYDSITKDLMPNMAARVAKKEQVITEMSTFIKANVPLYLAVFSFLPGLRVGFARALGEAGIPGQFTFVALRAFTATAGPTDYNLKHQIVRAYRTLQQRFPTNTDIAVQANADIEHLSFNADKELLDKIAAMKTELGI
jgi:hypothetical protein